MLKEPKALQDPVRDLLGAPRRGPCKRDQALDRPAAVAAMIAELPPDMSPGDNLEELENVLKTVHDNLEALDSR